MRAVAFLWQAAALAAVSVASLSFATETGTKFAIPAGQEPLVLQMLGGSDKLPGGCELANVSIRADQIDGNYTCSDGKKRLLLQHPTAGGGTAKKTTSFAVGTVDAKDALPTAAEDAILARIREREAKFLWQPLGAPSASVAPPPPPSASAPPPPPRDPEAGAAYAKGLELYRAHKDREALEIFLGLARKDPKQPGVLGMVVATLARTGMSASEVAALSTKADAAADDTLTQFIAGVANHYYAHNDATSAEEKRKYYETALHYLDRAKAFDFEARWYIYEAVSHFRLGHQEQAEAMIERAVALGSDDPDVYYCRAEIFQRTNIPRALEDIRTYQRMVKAIVQSTGIQSPDKERRVQMLYDHLLAVSRGEASSKELFDPVSSDAKYRRAAHELARRPTLFAGIAAGIAGVAFLAFRMARRRRPAKS